MSLNHLTGVLSGVQGIFKPRLPLQVYSLTSGTTATSLLPSQTDSMVMLPAWTNNCAISLPGITGSAGINYDLYVSGVENKTTTISSPSGAVFVGRGLNGVSTGTITGIGSGITGAAGSNLVLTNNGPGDYVSLACDGSKWYFNSVSGITGGVGLT